jgi:hypothetical protein
MYCTLLPMLLAVACGEARDKVAEQTAARLNTYRQAAGLKPVVVDAELSRGCLAHARYLARTIDPLATRKYNPHEEDPKKPGYTREGLTAARMSVILFFAGSFQPPATIDEHMASFFHRISLIRPDLKRIGFGMKYFKGNRCWVVINAKSGREAMAEKVDKNPLLYPAKDQKDIPLLFTLNEFPNPIPPEGRKNRCGYPITATFPAKSKVTRAIASLHDSAGKEVPVWFSSPAQPAHTKVQQYNTLCLIPKVGLKPATTYRVSLSATVDGKEWIRTWKFSTRKK